MEVEPKIKQQFSVGGGNHRAYQNIKTILSRSSIGIGLVLLERNARIVESIRLKWTSSILQKRSSLLLRKTKMLVI